jgi:hypothetical protein
VESRAQTGERVGIFVAADTEFLRYQARAQLKVSVPDAVFLPLLRTSIVNDLGFVPHRNAGTVRDALMELLILSRADTLVVTDLSSSTFSATAASLADCGGRTACYTISDNCQKLQHPVEPVYHQRAKLNCTATEKYCDSSFLRS